MRVIILLLTLVTLLSDVSADGIEDQYSSDLTELTNILFCGNKKTIKYIGKPYKACIAHVELLSEKCKLYMKYATSDFNDYDYLKEHEKRIDYIGLLYFSCVEAAIFQSKEGVKLFEPPPFFLKNK